MQVVERSAAPRSGSGRLISPVLVGREDELRLLTEAALDPPSLVILEGQAGIGKTRLVEELICSVGRRPSGRASRSAERRVLVGRGHRLREPFPFGPVVEALRAVAVDPPRATPAAAGALRPLLPELAELLPQRPPPLEHPRAERHRQLRSMLELLAALGDTLLVLEDLHWADAATVELLDFLACQLPPGLCVVSTFRREELDPGSPLLGLLARVSPRTLTRTLRLRPLDRGQTRELVEDMLGDARVSDELAATVHARTAGNAFAVEQLVRLLDDRGHLLDDVGRVTIAESARIGVPPALRDSVLQRIALLRGDAQRVIQAAAVLERDVGERMLAAVSGLSATRARSALCDALATSILQPTPASEYRFCHALAAAAVYEAIAPPIRAELHLRSARELRRAPEPRPLAQIAHHLKLGGRRRQWVGYAERAADSAAAVGDDADAAEQLREALAEPRLARAARVRMAIKLGHAALFSRSPRDATVILRAVLDERPLAAGLRGELRFYLAWLESLQAHPPGSVHQQFVTAAGELRRRPVLAARALAAVASGWAAAGDADQAREWLAEALAAVARACDPLVELEVLGARARVLVALGDPDAWRAVDELPWDAPAPGHKLELVRIAKNLADAACRLGHYRRAESLLARADELRAELGHGRFGIGLATVRAQLDWNTGRWEGLEASARRLVEASPDAPGWRGAGELILGTLQLGRGELDEAEERLRALVEGSSISAAPLVFANAAGQLATIRLTRGDAESACELVETGLEGIREGAWPHAHDVLPRAVDALLARGLPGKARALTERFALRQRERDAPAATAALAECRGALAEAGGDPASAADHFAAAERAWSALPAPYAAARARERRGLALLAAGGGADPDGGVECLLGALRAFESLPAPGDAGRVKATLRRHRIAVPYPWRGGPRGYGRELSPRETEVARLVCAGWTNREIAAELFVSPRTIDGHVASVLGKLDLRSRTQLASRLGGGGPPGTPRRALTNG